MKVLSPSRTHAPARPSCPQPAPARRSDEGFVLLAVMFLLAILIISMAVALPKIATAIQRDKEQETYQRGMQYRRAIQLYYRKFSRYPPNLDALVKTNEIRFLRKKYKDPMTGKDDWKPIQFGQNKTPMAMGFFGQPLGGMGSDGTVLAGTGPSGGNGIAGASSFGSSTGSSTGSSSFGNSIGSSSGSSSFGNSIGSSSAGSSSFGNSSLGGAGSTIGSSSPTGSTTAGSATAGTTAGSTDANGNPVGTGSLTGATGQTFGGAGIIGVEPASPKQSLFVYKKKNHYNEWEFLYSPMSEQMMMTGGNAGTALGTSGSGSTTGTGLGSGIGSGIGSGTGIGSSSGTGGITGSSGTGTTSTSPQQ